MERQIVDRFINIVLKILLLLATVGSLLSLVKMIMEQFMPVHYYWWAAVAFFGATISLASAIRLREVYAPATRQRLSGDDAVQS